jgi:hypothetical protein
MSQIGGQTGALGVNSLYAMLNALQGATGASGTLLGADVTNRYANMQNTGQQMGIGSMIGGSLFDLLKQFGLGGTGGGVDYGPLGSKVPAAIPSGGVFGKVPSVFGIPPAGSSGNI